MSIRFLHRIIRNGKSLLFRDKRYLYQFRSIHQKERLPKTTNILAETNFAKEQHSFIKFSRRLFIDNVLNRVTSPKSSSLVANATKKLAYGDSLPFLSLIACNLATGNGVLTKEDELEGLCWEIRNAISKYQFKQDENILNEQINEELDLKHFDIGPSIDKGCNAVVYAANFKNHLTEKEYKHTKDVDITYEESSERSATFSKPLHETTISTFDLNDLSSEINEGNSVVRFNNEVKVVENDRHFQSTNTNMMSSSDDDIFHYEQEDASIFNYPWALKMMFNYDIQSNAMAILKAMYKETIPARYRKKKENIENWENVIMEQTILLPPHPNIVLMPAFFCDQIPYLRNSHAYANALPPRLNPTSGYGRNMSLFLLMKRYNGNLRNFLNNSKDLDVRTRIILFTQLLEACAHINKHNIAHRDLKSDNILIDSITDSLPLLVISDFGCCLSDKRCGLQLPFQSIEIDKGGNRALMAPEIVTKEPSFFAILNYQKSDLWTCGTIAYEIFNSDNPFYTKSINNETYDDSMLPAITMDIPMIIRKLIENILQRNPRKRLNCNVAANVLQLYLWAPSSWIKYNRNPSNTELMEWLLSLTTKILCEKGIGSINEEFIAKSRRTYTEYVLISTFLSRAKLTDIREALNWIQSL
ncbi:hypothetical protein PVAND_011520 [Polypedilum vanderplanki]|uniref:non-specific serine/threonine protein kinase n=1 Tax=Polypedilum vanderplanki TaxID=319348 RepID=A0A9J6CKD2_POLVA|nr:hypothetical protein PVAND_011520 [Polypedilum vanderplanki]